MIPFNIYSGKAAGEGATMQGFEMLLYGTGNTLWNSSSKKWVVGSKGMTAAMNFLNTVFSEKLGPDPQDALDPQWGTKLTTQLIPQSKLAIDLDGSWVDRHLEEDRHQAVAAVQQGARHGRDADRERPGARHDEHVRRLAALGRRARA